jgi:hypothetical protein
VEAKAAFVHVHISPDLLDQLSLVDDFTGALGKGDEDIKGAASEVKRSSILLQEP